jgi:hypothetical protein
MTDFSHLSALQVSLHHEQQRATNAFTPAARTWRLHNVAMIEREIASEYAFLGIAPVELPEMTADELLAELAA